jgi:hypothetical protein
MRERTAPLARTRTLIAVEQDQSRYQTETLTERVSEHQLFLHIIAVALSERLSDPHPSW